MWPLIHWKRQPSTQCVCVCKRLSPFCPFSTVLHHYFLLCLQPHPDYEFQTNLNRQISSTHSEPQVHICQLTNTFVQNTYLSVSLQSCDMARHDSVIEYVHRWACVSVCVLRNITGMLCGATVALSDLWEWKTSCKRRCESVTSEVGASFLTRSFSWKVLLAVLLLHTRPAKVRTNVIEVFKKEVGGVALLQHVVFLTMDGSPWKCLMEGGEIHNFFKNIHSF